MKKILWFDNDIIYLAPYVDVLTEKGFAVEVAETTGEAERAINETPYPDLLILDVQVPIRTDSELLDYPPDETESGHSTGLCFFKRYKAALTEHGTSVLALTVRVDDEIRKEFFKAGLPERNFATKYGLRDVAKLLERVNSVLSD